MMRYRIGLLVLLAFAPSQAVSATPAEDLLLVNRLSWGETAQGDTTGGQSAATWLQQQLHPSDDDGLPPEVKARIDAMEISQRTPSALIADVRELQRQANRAKGGSDADATRKAFQQRMNDLMRQAQTR